MPISPRMCANDILANFRLHLNSALGNVLNERQLNVHSKSTKKLEFPKILRWSPRLRAVLGDKFQEVDDLYRNRNYFSHNQL